MVGDGPGIAEWKGSEIAREECRERVDIALGERDVAEGNRAARRRGRHLEVRDVLGRNVYVDTVREDGTRNQYDRLLLGERQTITRGHPLRWRPRAWFDEEWALLRSVQQPPEAEFEFNGSRLGGDAHVIGIQSHHKIGVVAAKYERTTFGRPEILSIDQDFGFEPPHVTSVEDPIGGMEGETSPFRFVATERIVTIKRQDRPIAKGENAMSGNTERIVVEFDHTLPGQGAQEGTARGLVGRIGAVALSAVIVAGGLVLSISLLAGSPGSAAVATTQHELPGSGSPGVMVECQSAGYSCTPGYSGSNATGWAWVDYGCPSYAAGCAAGTPHNCTLYAAFRLMRNGYGNPGWSGNADQWAEKASAHGTLVNQTPDVGAIAEWNSDGDGHVAYVESSDSGGITLTMDDWSDRAPYPNGYTAEMHIAPGSPAWPDNFIHFADQSGSGSATASSAPSDSHVVTVVNATGGVFWRSSTDWNTPIRVDGSGVYNGDHVALLCWQRGASNTPPYRNNPLWYQAAVVQGRGKGQGWVNDHFLTTGSNVPNVPVGGVPTCSSPSQAQSATSPQPAAGGSQLQPAAGGSQLQPTGQPQGGSTTSNPGGSGVSVPSAPTGPSSSSVTAPQSPTPQRVSSQPNYSETTGGVSHTWTDYHDAGGTEGPSIADNQTVQIACKVTGFAVADGNTWWYQIHSSPWSDTYFVSADAFYNDGATSGGLIGTPFVDPAVPDC